MSNPGFETTPGSVALVTGSSGFCGARLVEMLLERGAKTVIAMDLVAPNATLSKRFAGVQEATKGKIILLSGEEGDLTKAEAVDAAFAKEPKIDVVYHIAALVGPFHDYDLYYKVNVLGTRHVLDCCKKYKVPKLINSSSPSTRFHGPDVEGPREEELTFPKKFLARYAETKAQAEQEVSAACDGKSFLTVSIAPHQVYGPYDGLFFPKLMETCGNGRLRVFGKGQNLISVCYVDNYCHGLLCGADKLIPGSPILGKFYIVTDGPPQKFWSMINNAGMQLGFADLESKFHLPTTLLYAIAYICNVIGYLIGKKFKLNPFNVRMLTIHRYFSIENAKRDLEYQPLQEFDDAWQLTIDWFKENWLPGFLEETGIKPKQS